MEFTAYTMADLQRTRSILQGLVRDGVTTTEQALELLNSMVKEQHQHIVQAPARQGTEVEICPKCGKGVITLWHGSSIQVQAPVYGCKKCQWSEVRP